MKVLRGLASAIPIFVLVGIAIPFVLNYFAPTLSTYVPMPPPAQVWGVFVLFGALLAVTGFLQNGYRKGEFPWLFGKLAAGLVELGMFYYVFLALPKSLAAGSAGVESSGLVSLLVLAVVLSYGYLVFDFWDARRRLTKDRDTTDTANPPMTSLA